MKKASYDYPTKRKWRERWLSFLEKFLEKTGKKPKKFKVVCLPGEEALEIFQVYDKLKIPRKNITGLECDDSSYRKLKRKDLGIELFHGFDHEYFEQLNEKVDIVLLDYESQFNPSTLELIVGNQLLEERSVLGTNFVGKREKSNLVYNEYKFSMISKEFFMILDESYKRKRDLKEVFGLLNNVEENVEHIPLQKLRTEGITYNLLNILINGKNNLILNPFLEKISSTRNFLEKFSLETAILIAKMPLARHNLLVDLFWELKNINLPVILSNFILWGEVYPYFAECLESYKYDNDAGTSMFSNFLRLNQCRKILDKEEFKAIRKDIHEKGFDKKPGKYEKEMLLQLEYKYRGNIKFFSKKKAKEWEGDRIKIASLYRTHLFSKIRRINLGSSYKPILSDKKAKELVKQGLTIEEIEKDYRIKNRNKLGAFIAHRTMGTYSEKQEILEKRVEEQPKPKVTRKYEKYKEIEIIPHKYQKKLSNNAKLRIQNFNEDISYLPNYKRKKLLQQIRDSGWYKNLNSVKQEDVRMYAFFDDVTLAIKRGERISQQKIRNLYEKVMHEEKLYTASKYPKYKPKLKKPSEKQKQEIFAFIGDIPDQEIMNTYGITKMQLAGYKAYLARRS